MNDSFHPYRPIRRDFPDQLALGAENDHRAYESKGLIFDISQDYLTESHSNFRKEYPVYYIVGSSFYSLLKLYLKKPVNLAVGDLIDLDENKNAFQRIKRITIDQILKGAEYILEEMLIKLVKESELSKFVKFFNEAKPITVKLHQFTLLPGIGQKRMWTLLDARKMKVFESYKDIEERAGFDPVPIIVKRIIEELSGKERHNLFTRTIPMAGEK
jgi:putative nucleotide binding protein